MTKATPQSLFPEGTPEKKGVECLGLKFASEEERRRYFTKKLREKLREPEFRRIEGFPLGTEEDILNLSDPPYFTACPNPWVEDFIRLHGKSYDPKHDAYHAKPFAADVSEGKQDPICMAHTYHTKVPFRAVARYIMHYTKPGDLVLDSFSGTGMTGVACQFCASPDEQFQRAVQAEWADLGDSPPQWGPRQAILCYLSPFAAFLTRCYNTDLSRSDFETWASRLLSQSQESLGWVYETDLPKRSEKVRFNYMLWADSLFCECGAEVLFWQPADPSRITGNVDPSMSCPKCGAIVEKRSVKQAKTTFHDEVLKVAVTQNKQQPVLVEYPLAGDVRKKSPSAFDLQLIAKINGHPIRHYVPTQQMMFKDEKWGDMHRSGYHFGVTHAHHFWTRRNLLVLGDLFERARAAPAPHELMFLCTSFAVKTGSRMHNIGLKEGRINLAGQTYNTLQLTSLAAERNLFTLAAGKLEDLKCVFEMPKRLNRVCVGTQSATKLVGVPDKSIDYVFIDPPFGDNIIYSELSFLYECWLKVFTNQRDEAIVSTAQDKDLHVYQQLMLQSFSELYRVLKPGRWITVAFHNSKNAVWNAIQEALGLAGFIIADVRIIDKGQGTYKQMTTKGAVKKDLAISAYRPSSRLEERFSLVAGTPEGAWEFVRTHLSQLPVLVCRGKEAEINAERQKYLIFDRMVAFHVQHGVSVPLSASEFYAGLLESFPERDGMYFLPTQVTEYEGRRLHMDTVHQLELWVSDEKSAIQWVRQQLHASPVSYADLQPLYMQEAQRAWEKYEKPIELQTILDENFVRDPDGRWRNPDPRKESDLEQLRHRHLLKEFQSYQERKGKLRQVRTEAIRAGFKECWQKGDYAAIVELAKRLPDAVVQEDLAILMYYDNAQMRAAG